MKETNKQVADHAQFLSHLDAAKLAMYEESIAFYRQQIKHKEEQIKKIKERYQPKN